MKRFGAGLACLALIACTEREDRAAAATASPDGAPPSAGSPSPVQGPAKLAPTPAVPKPGCASPQHPTGGKAWEGWSLHPGLPCKCRGVYVPDAVEKRVPPLEWVPCEGFPCQRLNITWAPAIGGKSLGVGFYARGAKPSLIALGRWFGDSLTGQQVVYDGSGVPLAAWWWDPSEDAAQVDYPAPSADGKWVTANFGHLGGCDETVTEQSFVAPVGELSPLMHGTTPAVRWTPEFLHGRHAQALTSSGDLVVLDLVATVAVGDTKTGVTTDVSGGPDQGWWRPIGVIDRTVFMSRRFGAVGWGNVYEVWVSIDAGPAKPLIQVPKGSVGGFVADGVTMAWSEDTEPSSDPWNAWASHEAFVAPYTTEPAKVVKESVGKLPMPWVALRTANGYVSGGDFEDGFVGVLRLKDRAWLRFEKPKNWFLETSPSFTSETELWLHVGIGTLDTLVRIPYEVLTPYTPGGG